MLSNLIQTHFGGEINMFRVIAVDDEIGSLNRLRRIAEKESRIQDFQTFLTASQAKDYVASNPVDIALLDIEMPETDGIQLAEELMKFNPYLEVIFVTAYNQYALQAFQAHATGYLLKPIAQSDFSKQLDILELKRTPEIRKTNTDSLIVHCLGPFSCHSAAKPDAPIRFRTAKAEELFALLIFQQERPRSKDYILEVLWPDSDDLTKTANNFRVTCSYVRNALSDAGFSDILLRSKDDYFINTKKITCDLYTFRAALDSYHTLPLDKLTEITSLYQGEFLENRLYEWALEPRHWIENSYLKMQMRRLNFYTEQKDFVNADEIVKAVLIIDPFNENVLERSIRLKIDSCDFSGAKALFLGYKQRLASELGEKPSARLSKLIADI